jgi:ABC-2 type transport system ATP-binding protein
MEDVAAHDLGVMLSSHLVADIERVCDYLIVLVDSRVQLAGDVDDLLASHHRLVGPRDPGAEPPACQEVIGASHTERQTTLIVRSDGPVLDPAWTIEPTSLEDLVLAYMARGSGSHEAAPTSDLGAAT